MPGLDGTGPDGRGPGTGGRRGSCRVEGNVKPDYQSGRYCRANSFFRFFGMGLGLALRRRRGKRQK